MFWQGLVAVLALGVIAYHLYRNHTMGRRLTGLWDSGLQAFERRAFDDARRAFARIVSLTPSSAAPRRMLARTLVALEQEDEAEQQFRMAAALEPRNGDGQLELGVFLAVHRPALAEEAADAIEQALSLAPELRDVVATWRLPPQVLRNARLRAFFPASGD